MLESDSFVCGQRFRRVMVEHVWIGLFTLSKGKTMNRLSNTDEIENPKTPPFCVGMDLGTYKTSVVASNGNRAVAQSIVGFPKDHIARAALGCDVLFGSEVLDRRLSLDYVRPFQNGGLKYADPAEAGVSAERLDLHKQSACLLINHIVSLVAPPPDVPVFGVIGVPSRASIQNKQFIIEAASQAFDAIIVVAEPFSVAYGMNLLTNVLVVDIGAGTTDLCPMYGSYPTDKDQITVPIGGSHIDEAFLRLMKDVYPNIPLSLRMAQQIKEKYGFVGDEVEQISVPLRIGGLPKQINVTAPLQAACSLIVQQVIEAIKTLIGSFDPEFQSSLLSNILLCGGGSQLQGFEKVIRKALEPYGACDVTRANDCVFAGAAGALRLAMNMPQDHWNQLTRNEPSSKTKAKPQSADSEMKVTA
jgi:rod shape-determining protein MreB and related proteins